jgi:uncharacterized protein YjbI with pentapeptide repeats
VRFTPDQLDKIGEVAYAETRSFVKLTELAGLNPAQDFINSDLERVNFGSDNLNCFRFFGAHLRGADLSRAKGLGREPKQPSAFAGVFSS